MHMLREALSRPVAALPNSWRRPAWRVPAALAPSVDTGSRVGVWGRGEQAVDIFDTSSKVTLEERRAADGLDAYVPRILRGDVLCDADVDRFFLDLPLNGVRSRHSLRAYGYDRRCMTISFGRVWFGFTVASAVPTMSGRSL